MTNITSVLHATNTSQGNGINSWQSILIFLAFLIVFIIFTVIKKIYYSIRFQKRFYIIPKTSVKGISNIAMVISISVAVIILLTVLSANTASVIFRAWPGTRVTLEGILVKIGGLLFGPILGIFIGAMTDLLSVAMTAEYYTGTLSKIHAFSVLGKDLKEDLKNEAKANEKEYVEDKKIEDWQYYEHDRGLNGVYPYAFLAENNALELKVDDFIKARKFVEAIKASNTSRTILPITDPKNNQVLSKQAYSQLAMIALENKDANIHDLSSFESAKNNLKKYLFDLNDIKSVNVNYSKWNEKNL